MLSKKKIEQLSEYYLKHGFDHTTDEIVEGLDISHKTFFNRYKSKEDSVNLVIDNWYENIQQRFAGKKKHCNHAVEELFQLVYEIRFIHEKESVFFQHMQARGLFVSDQAPFVGILKDILQNGITHYQFKEDFNVDLFARFMLNNLAHYIYNREDVEDVVDFLLAPILSIRGKTLLEEMDIASFL